MAGTSRLIIPNLSGPTIDRVTTLRMQGDWGSANIHAICGWLAQEFWDRSPLETRTAIWNGRGAVDSLSAVASGEVDLAVCTPSEFAAMAYRGVGMFEGKPYANLRALGRIPQDDRLVFAIESRLGLTTFEEIRKAQPALRIATSPDDGVNWIGYAARKALQLEGISSADFASWGGSFVEAERPPDCATLVVEGKADAILHEGISGPWWPQLAKVKPLSYIPFEAGAIRTAMDSMQWTSDQMPAGLFPGIGADFVTLNFDDFTVLVRDDMPDDVAHVLSWCLIETRANLERKYAHIPTARSPINHPMDPRAMVDTLVPLHAAAERCYRKMGLLDLPP